MPVFKHEGEDVGGWDTVLKKAEYEQLFYNQQATMEGGVREAAPAAPVIPVIDQTDIEESAKSTQAASVKAGATVPSHTLKAPIAPTAVQGAKPKEEYVAPDIENGMTVFHAKFGEGTVKIDKAKKFVTVTFRAGEKKSIFPDAFKNGYLKFKND